MPHFSRADRRWSSADDARLRELLRMDPPVPVGVIASDLKRPASAVRRRIEKKGLKRIQRVRGPGVVGCVAGGVRVPHGMDERLFSRCRQLAEALAVPGRVVSWHEIKAAGLARACVEDLARQGGAWFAADHAGVMVTDEGRAQLLGGPVGQKGDGRER